VKQPVRVGVSLSLLVGALLVMHLRSAGEAVPIRKSLDSFPNAVGQWQAREGVLLDLDTLNVLRPKDYLMRRDQDPGGRSVFLFIAYWDSQRKGSQPHSPRNCLPGSGWERVTFSCSDVQVLAGVEGTCPLGSVQVVSSLKIVHDEAGSTTLDNLDVYFVVTGRAR